MTAVVGKQLIHLDGRLGAGHFGEVFRGRLRPFGVVAVKVVKGALARDDWRDHLLKEADRLHEAQHPNVVRFLACAHDADEVFIVTELCKCSVADDAGMDPVPVAQLRRYVRESLLGLEALHQRQMIHRDIKPGNLLVTESDRVKLADFGLVSDELVNGYASYQGYYHHLAPEVFTQHTTSMKTDVWAMGLTIYRLLNGECWWREWLRRKGVDLSDAEAAKADILQGNLAGRLVWMPHVPDRWRRFVRSCLRDDAAARLQNATQMLTGITNLPDAPSWRCLGSSGRLRWELDARRRTVVEWRGWLTGQHAVSKWTEPLPCATGRTRTTGKNETRRFEDARRYAEVLLGTRTT